MRLAEPYVFLRIQESRPGPEVVRERQDPIRTEDAIPSQPGVAGRGDAGSRWTVALLAVLFLAIRIPLLRGGFGSDDDAWRNAANALRMLEEHRYVPSRAPGFPAYDAVLIALVALGPIATNLASVAFQALACLGTWWIERRAGFARPGLVAAALALASPFAVTATQTMDYALSAAAITLAYLFLLRDASRRTGLFAGLATGARASNALVLPAALLDSWLRRRAPVAQPSPSRWSDRDLIVVFLVTVAALFLPVVTSGAHTPQSGNLLDHVRRHHATAQTFVPHARGLISFLLGKTAPLWIVLGLVGTIVRRPRGAAAAPAPQGAPVFELTCVVLATALYFAVPYTPAYLLPVFPLILLLLRRLLPTWAFTGLAVMLALEVLALPLLSERRLVPGALLLERAARHQQSERTIRLRELPEHPTVRIVTRQDLHRLLFSDPPLRRLPPVWEPFATPGVALAEVDGSTLFADSLTADDRARLTGRGFTIQEARGDIGPTRPNPEGPGAKAARMGF